MNKEKETNGNFTNLRKKNSNFLTKFDDVNDVFHFSIL